MNFNDLLKILINIKKEELPSGVSLIYPTTFYDKKENLLQLLLFICDKIHVIKYLK